MDPIIPSTRGTAIKEQNIQQTPQKNANGQQLFLKTRSGNIRGNGKENTPRAEEGYCNEAKLKVKQWQHKTKHYKRNTMQQKYWTQKRIANADVTNNLIRQ